MVRVASLVLIALLFICQATGGPSSGVVRNVVQGVRGSTSDTVLVFLLDGSGSIDSDSWAVMRSSTSTLIKSLHAPKVHIATIIFSDDAVVVCDLAAGDPTAIHSCTNGIEKAIQPRGMTFTAKGLQAAKEQFQKAPRDSVKRLILLTDGAATDNPIPIADELKLSGVTIAAIGFGSVSTDSLIAVASDKAAWKAEDMKTIAKELYAASTIESLQGLNSQVTFLDIPYKFADTVKFVFELDNSFRDATIPVGTKITFMESSKNTDRPHFKPTRVVLQKAVPAGASGTVEGTLEPYPQVKFDTLPECITWELTSPNGEARGFFNLSSSFFIKDLTIQISKVLKKYPQAALPTINILEVGPIGSGKSTVINSMLFSITPVLDLPAAAFIGTGTEHGTLLTEYIRIDDVFLDDDHEALLQDLRLRFIDTEGVDDHNFQGGFFKSLIAGVVEDGCQTSNQTEQLNKKMAEFSSNPQQALKTQPHAVLFVVTFRIGDSELKKAKFPIQIEKVKEMIKLAKLNGHNPIAVSTFMDQVDLENHAPTLKAVGDELGISEVYPFSGYSEIKGRVFERDIQALNILQSAIQKAFLFLKKRNNQEQRHDEL